VRKVDNLPVLREFFLCGFIAISHRFTWGHGILDQ